MSAFPLERKELSASEEAAGILAHSIRIRTPNPPGNERPLAETYVSLLASEAIDARVIPVPSDSGAALVPTETPAQRALAWARYPGRGTQPPLVLLSHLDTVDADPADWDHDPFAGTRIGDYIIGRGAIDAQGVGVVHVLTLMELARRGLPLDRDLILLATPDEEAGGIHGAGYVTRAHRDLLGNARYLLTEGNDAQAKRAARRSRVKSTRKRSAQRGEAQPS
ncbi:MAG: M20/M25/M40 family metallo-hydrolase [Myxococcales bacterium]|nr:M20/M25/M40 family metallo-hydrolase [Myxococcales bacterium]